MFCIRTKENFRVKWCLDAALRFLESLPVYLSTKGFGRKPFLIWSFLKKRNFKKLNAKPYYQLIEIKGTAFERGKRYGSSASGAIKRNIDFYSSAFEKSANIDCRRHRNSPWSFFLWLARSIALHMLRKWKALQREREEALKDILTLNCRSEVLFAKAGCLQSFFPLPLQYQHMKNEMQESFMASFGQSIFADFERGGIKKIRTLLILREASFLSISW